MCREDSYAQSIKYVTVKLCNAPAQARDGCARGGRDHADGTGADNGALYGLDGRFQCMSIEYTSSVRLIEQGAGFLIDVLFD